MKKKIPAGKLEKEQETAEKEPGGSGPVPKMNQLTFTEQEHKDILSLVNYYAKNAVFKEIGTREAGEFMKLYARGLGVIKKIENHILELKAIHDPETGVTTRFG